MNMMRIIFIILLLIIAVTSCSKEDDPEELDDLAKTKEELVGDFLAQLKTRLGKINQTYE